MQLVGTEPPNSEMSACWAFRENNKTRNWNNKQLVASWQLPVPTYYHTSIAFHMATGHKEGVSHVAGHLWLSEVHINIIVRLTWSLSMANFLPDSLYANLRA